MADLAGAGGVAPAKDRTGQQLILLLFLLLFYCLGPLVALALAIWSIGPGGTIENETLSSILIALASDPSAYTSVLNQMIVPVVAAVTAANYVRITTHRLSKWLFLLPLATIFVCIVGGLFFTAVSFSDVVVDNRASVAGAISQLYLSWAGTLAVYVMLLVGLQLADKAATP